MVFFTFIQMSIEHSVNKQWDPDQTLRSVASDLGLHCLPGCYNRLIWVKHFFVAVGHIVYVTYMAVTVFEGNLLL